LGIDTLTCTESVLLWCSCLDNLQGVANAVLGHFEIAIKKLLTSISLGCIVRIILLIWSLAMLDIQYYIKTNYGQDMMYPKSNDAMMIASVYGTKTIQQYMIDIFIDWLGGTATEVLPDRSK
jgi:hypothetical protein